VVYVGDDDDGVLGALQSFLEADGHLIEDYGRGEAFLAELAQLALVAAQGKRWPLAE
jgi:FixJ family two-component response regulator